MSHRGRHRAVRNKCHECGTEAQLYKFKGRMLCRLCLNPPEEAMKPEDFLAPINPLIDFQSYGFEWNKPDEQERKATK